MSTVRATPLLGVSSRPLERARDMRISRLSKSTSSHWRAKASPIRIPVRASNRSRGARRGATRSAAARKSVTWSRVMALISSWRRAGLIDSLSERASPLLAFTTITPSSIAELSTTRRVACMIRTDSRAYPLVSCSASHSRILPRWRWRILTPPKAERIAA